MNDKHTFKVEISGRPVPLETTADIAAMIETAIQDYCQNSSAVEDELGIHSQAVTATYLPPDLSKPLSNDPAPDSQLGTQIEDATELVVRIAKVIAYARLKNAYGTVQDKDLDDMWPRMIVEAKAVEGLLETDRIKADIAAYPGWGAGLAALAERHDEIAKQIGIPLVRQVNGEPCAD